MKRSLPLLPLLVFFAACKTTPSTEFKPITVKYPVTQKDTSIKDDYFGTTVADPYRWLENDTAENTKAWVKAQNEVTQGYLSQIPFRSKIESRLKELWNYDSYSAPTKYGNYTYFYKKTGLQNQSVLYRQKDGETDAEVFLDPNTFSSNGTTSLAAINFTKDGALCAYQVSEGGSDWRKMIVMDAITKKQIGDTMIDVKFSGVAWKKNEGFYYSSYDKPKEGSQLAGKTDQHKLFYHALGQPQSQDKLVFGGSTTPRRYISGDVTENGKWLVIYAANSTYGSEIYVQDLTKPDAPITALIGDMNNSSGVLGADDRYFYIQTDKDAPKGKIVTAPLADPKPANWKTLVPEQPEVLGAGTAGGNIFCVYLKDAITKVVQYDMAGKKIRDVQLPGPGSAYGFGGKDTDKELYFTFTSYIAPSTIYKMDIASGKSEVYKKSGVKFNSEDYESNQVFYKSKDGTKIPMIITHKKGIKLDGSNPTLLYAYGGFSVSITPYFSTSDIVLLENGGIYAVANLRGGGEYGEEWHNAGIKTKKQNVFDDFAAAAQYLVDNKYTSREKLAIQGESNGGLLIGATITQHPDICKVAFPFVGVMDMLRYHKFTAGAGWAYDYGTSEDSKEMFEYLKRYSPVHNLKEGTSYPATFITTADHDDRVVPAHSFKFAATLQEKHKGENPVLISIETKAGHGAGRSMEQVIRAESDKWAFMFYNMKVAPK
ncbi:S9 family peptidase [Sediminibacterium roseum]|uniref:prolyl oligopeptidase n=1 Tax=Sediminibacterium roseum TaxID=1978412 RepID=A0ABW9ZTX4_9BACT|nr:prolyl oligopeptidase family serine peptidase [Sediminibacterium roseum]NCI50591.1 S9 family peptidase [Sediminibacterium roseum]